MEYACHGFILIRLVVIRTALPFMVMWKNDPLYDTT